MKAECCLTLRADRSISSRLRAGESLAIMEDTTLSCCCRRRCCRIYSVSGDGLSLSLLCGAL